MSAPGAGQCASPIHVDFRARERQASGDGAAVRLYRSGRWVVVEVAGEMDLQVVPLVPDLLGFDSTFVVFELRAVTFIDASGLGVIAETQAQAVAVGGCVRLVAPSRQVRRLLVLADPERTFALFDSVAEAVLSPVDPAGDGAS